MKTITPTKQAVLKRIANGIFKNFHPDKNPNESNNQRVRRQRKLSGRFDPRKDTKNR